MDMANGFGFFDKDLQELFQQLNIQFERNRCPEISIPVSPTSKKWKTKEK